MIKRILFLLTVVGTASSGFPQQDIYGTDMGFDSDMYETTLRILETEDEQFYKKDLFSYLKRFGVRR